MYVRGVLARYVRGLRARFTCAVYVRGVRFSFPVMENLMEINTLRTLIMENHKKDNEKIDGALHIENLEKAL